MLPVPPSSSGPVVAQAFQRMAGLVIAIAWLSLSAQLDTLMGAEGLLPANETLIAIEAAGLDFVEAPTLFSSGVHDATLRAGTLLGVFLSLCGGLGLWPRLCFPASGALYLSYTVLGGDFLAFQWDNLLVETCALLAFLPRRRPAPWVHLSFRVLLFKLYFESGVAKWQSHLGDWQDGSAMTHYYETAPLPAWLGYYAHQLPPWVHRAESWAVLLLELPLALLVFGPRRARLLLCTALTLFQLINTATANYGFFTYLSLALHLFLLSDRDLVALRWFRVPHGPLPPVPVSVRTMGRLVGAVALSGYLGGSLTVGLTHLGARNLREPVLSLARPLVALRLTNAYHLFGHITRTRIEPEFQLRVDGQWQAQPLHYKPGPEDRRPPYVAPHQPRVDFRLWFYGLSFRRGMPRYVRALLERLCDRASSVQSLFPAPLPPRPEAVRVAFHRYTFTEPRALSGPGRYWKREPVGHTRPRACDGGHAIDPPRRAPSTGP